MQLHWKYLLLFFLTIIFAQTTFAQPEKDSMIKANLRYAGDLYYQDSAWDLALNEYLKVWKMDTARQQSELAQRIGHCYFLLKNPKFAAIFHERVINWGGEDPEVLYEYSESLRELYRLEEYKNWSLKFSEARNASSNPSQFPAAPSWNLDPSDNSQWFEVKPHTNSTLENVAFASKLRFGWLLAVPEGEKFAIWFAEEGKEAPFEMKGLFRVGGKLEKLYAGGTITAAPVGDQVIFTGKSDKGYFLYQAEWDRRNHKIKKVKKPDLGPGQCAWPVLSPDGSSLTFSSDRAGGQGGWDLWKAYRVGDDWTEATNLGASINSPADELHPLLLPDQSLFFTSNRGGGPGKQDYWVTEYDFLNTTYKNPFVLPAPFNSSGDDAGLCLFGKQPLFAAPGGLNGLVSSRQVDGTWQLKTLEKRRKFTSQVIRARRRRPVEGATVLIRGNKGQTGRTHTDEEGNFSFFLQDNGPYTVQINHPEYDAISYNNLPNRTLSGLLSIRESEYCDLNLFIYDSMNFLKLRDAEIEIVKNEQDTLIYKPDTTALFFLELEPGNAYKLRISQEGYFDYRETFTANRGQKDLRKKDIRMRRKIGTFVWGKLDFKGGATKLKNPDFVIVTSGQQVEALAPPEIDENGRYSLFLEKKKDYTIFVTLDGKLAGKTKIKTDQGNTDELTDTMDVFIDIDRLKPGDVLYTFENPEDPIQLQAGVYKEMKEVEVLFKLFPELRLEFTVHTTQEGSSRQNRRESQEAAEFGVDYYYYRDWDKKRIVPKGYGESEPLKNCAGGNCSEEEKRANRRVEIRVLEL